MSHRPRRLVLVRHAHAVRLDAAGAARDDLGRPLSDRGRAEVPGTAAWLHGAGAAGADLVLVSPAVRTRQTWNILRGSSPGVVAARELVDDDLYATSAQGLVAVLSQLADDVSSVLVVGHEPVLSGASSALAGPPERTGSPGGRLAALRAGLAPATAVVLDADVEDWGALAAGTCRLVALGPA